MCPGCGATFTVRRWSQTYCTPPCRDQFNKRKHEVRVAELRAEIERLKARIAELEGR